MPRKKEIRAFLYISENTNYKVWQMPGQTIAYKSGQHRRAYRFKVFDEENKREIIKTEEKL